MCLSTWAWAARLHLYMCFCAAPGGACLQSLCRTCTWLSTRDLCWTCPWAYAVPGGVVYQGFFPVVSIYFERGWFVSVVLLKGQCPEIFCFWFFYESVSPQPQSIPLGPFRFFSKIRGHIRSSRLTTGVADTGGKWKKSSIRKILIIFVGTPLDSRVNIYINFCLQVHFKVPAAWS